METHEFTVNGQHAATVTVRSPIELLTHAAAIRAVWTPRWCPTCGDTAEWCPDRCQVTVQSRLIRMH